MKMSSPQPTAFKGCTRALHALAGNCYDLSDFATTARTPLLRGRLRGFGCRQDAAFAAATKPRVTEFMPCPPARILHSDTSYLKI
jgi:hypothetical protein